MGEKVKKTKVWIAPVGWSPMAVVNTIWAYHNKSHVFPDEYYFLFQDVPRIKKDLDTVYSWLSKFHQKLPIIKSISLKDESVKSFLDGLSSVMRELLNFSTSSPNSNDNESEVSNHMENSKEIFLDMTPGRKFMSMIMGIVGLNKPGQISAVYYNYIIDDKYNNDPFPLVPKIDQELYNILEYQKDLSNFPIMPDPKKANEELSKKIKEIIKASSSNGISKNKIKQQLLLQNYQFESIQFGTIIETFVKNKLVKLKEVQSSNGNKSILYSDIIKPNIEKNSKTNVSLTSEKIKSGQLDQKIFTSLHAPESLSFCYLSLKELVMLLNELYDYKFENIRIEAAPFGLHLGDFVISDQINFKYVNQSFEEQANTTLNLPQNIMKEIDISYSWADLLIMAGLVFPENFDDVKRMIQDALNYSPLNGELPPVIGMDSNLFRFRFYSLYRNYIYDPKFQKRVGFCISETVHYELNYSQKYGSDLQQILDAIPSYIISPIAEGAEWYKEIVKDFSNQNKFIDRKKRLGMEELNTCIQNEIIFNCEKSQQDSDNDFLIIDEMKNFISTHDFRLFLMSNDKDFVAKAKGIPNVQPILVDYPRTRIGSEIKAKWIQFLQYIYVTAIWYGGILLIDTTDNTNVPIAAINGIWKGKDDSDWQECRLKIKADEAILKSIKANLKMIH